MNKKVFPQLGEQYFEQRLENGMMVRVVEKPGFAKKYAFVAVNFGSTRHNLSGYAQSKYVSSPHSFPSRI